jgi:hypothetical protein
LLNLTFVPVVERIVFGYYSGDFVHVRPSFGRAYECALPPLSRARLAPRHNIIYHKI